MNKSLQEAKNEVYRNLGEFFSSPSIAALCQANPLSAGVAAYFSGGYDEERDRNISLMLLIL